MCDTFAENYAAQINGFASDTSDLQPTMVLFNDPHCGGTFFPSAMSAVPSNPFTQGQTLTSGTDFTFTPLSLFLPYTFQTVTMTSQNGHSATFLGPASLPDLSLVNWQTGGTAPFPSMADDPIKTITLQTLQPWTNSVLSMCMGETRFIDVYPLSRFYPQSERCDAFMPDFCSVPVNQTLYADQCSCLLEQPALEAESKKFGVTLPVVCFGENCATTLSYKTSNMMSEPCNLTICQQIISSTPGIVNEGQDTIFCGGQFYKANGSLVVPSVTPLPAPSNAQQEGTPFYVWIMLGVSAALFAVLVILLFLEKPKKEVNVLRQIRKLQSQRRVYNISNPGTLPNETSATSLTSITPSSFVEY